MNTQEFMNCVYDLLAQNPVKGAYGLSGGEHDYITEFIDHVDTQDNYIRFKNPKNGREFRLQLVDEYAPAPNLPRLE